MALVDEIRADVKEVFSKPWATRDGNIVPNEDDLKLGNDAVKLKGVVLYADLAESTEMVKKYTPSFAAEVYKSFLKSACRVIRHNGGEITAFDGDRIMAVFIGERPKTMAAKTALNINWIVQNIVNEELKEQYSATDIVVRHAVGVDSSDLFIARTGIRGSNDLVWVGRAANFAAKLCTLRANDYTSWITEAVYEAMSEEVKYGGPHKLPMWEKRVWNPFGIYVYRSSWLWQP